jgi:L-rhamnose mutarotase
VSGARRHQRLGLTARLVDDPRATAIYDRYHSAVWPEVVANGRAAGAIRTTIFRDGRRLFMVIDAEDDFDLGRYGHSLSSPRTVEWQRLMDALLEDQRGPGEKWRPIAAVCDVP